MATGGCIYLVRFSVEQLLQKIKNRKNLLHDTYYKFQENDILHVNDNTR